MIVLLNVAAVQPISAQPGSMKSLREEVYLNRSNQKANLKGLPHLGKKVVKYTQMVCQNFEDILLDILIIPPPPKKKMSTLRDTTCRC